MYFRDVFEVFCNFKLDQYNWSRLIAMFVQHARHIDKKILRADR